MSAVKNHFWDEISEDFMASREPKYDPEEVDAAQRWYQEFTGNRGNASLDEIMDMYYLLQRSMINVY